MAYASTLVTYGQGRGVVTSTGDHTEIGRISEMISAAQSLETPLTRKIKAFGHKLLILILGLAGLVVAVGLWRGESLDEILSSAIALAVGAIPEGLPVAVTVTLAIGVSRMARRRAIIRKLPAVETLGSTTVICTDKTGTLTQNQMTVRQVVVGDEVHEVGGNGYEPSGDLMLDGQRLTPGEAPGLSECLLAGLVCNDSALVQKEGRWDAQGDPTEVALIVAARKAGLDGDAVKTRLPRVDAIPFESQHQFMATLHDDAHGERKLVYLKGAVEVVLDRCNVAFNTRRQPIKLDRERIQKHVSDLAASGLRVLAFARAELPADTQRISAHSLPHQFTFLGLQGMIDPPRPEAVEAVAACHRAGIQVKMITGDHAGTAVAIGRQLGLVQEATASPHPLALTGKELAALSDEQLIEAAGNVSVFARVTPEQKLRLVEALQARGHVVAMTGDGVNDGPAIKQADIGVAMGITGTEVAKEASDMVLTDDNFASIAGRRGGRPERVRQPDQDHHLGAAQQSGAGLGDPGGGPGGCDPAHPAHPGALDQHDHRRRAGAVPRARTQRAGPHAAPAARARRADPHGPDARAGGAGGCAHPHRRLRAVPMGVGSWSRPRGRTHGRAQYRGRDPGAVSGQLPLAAPFHPIHRPVPQRLAVVGHCGCPAPASRHHLPAFLELHFPDGPDWLG